ncbi:MAG TPA: DUF397 domain-containing protein [Actinophytocola sp.]|nr:DUF397 domain-containing protein [Actinophytocola sp.]HET9141969.1 DUF397 domain-containing protein [Actinophytocola sp.]
MTRPEWRKSSQSGSHNASCVEIAFASTSAMVRDSKHPTGPRLEFSPIQWGHFVHSLDGI